MLELSGGFHCSRHCGVTWRRHPINGVLIEEEPPAEFRGRDHDQGQGLHFLKLKVFLAFGRQKEVANLFLSLYFANSVNHGYLRFVSLKLRTSSTSSIRQRQTNNLRTLLFVHTKSGKQTKGRHGSFSFWMHVWVAGKSV